MGVGDGSVKGAGEGEGVRRFVEKIEELQVQILRGVAERAGTVYPVFADAVGSRSGSVGVSLAPHEDPDLDLLLEFPRRLGISNYGSQRCLKDGFFGWCCRFLKSRMKSRRFSPTLFPHE